MSYLYSFAVYLYVNGSGSITSVGSRRDSPVRGQIYLLKIASIYGHFTPIGA